MLQAEHRTMAVFILAVIVNSYNTGQVRVCVRICVCFPLLTRGPKGRTYQIIHLLTTTRTTAGSFGASRHFERLLYCPLCISGRYWLCDSFVTNSHLYNLRLCPSHLHGDTISQQVSLRPAPGLRFYIPEAFCV